MMEKDVKTPQKVALIGAGSIGVSWAVVFASAGYSVGLFDTAESSLSLARTTLSSRLEDLNKFGLIGESIDVILARVSFDTDIEKTIDGSCHAHSDAKRPLIPIQSGH